jgi:1-aminocyclopropane-1-carboxylate deaminase/D-cysteine desulfhydrase-like pyridoxal-dependent ACC family enzyme
VDTVEPALFRAFPAARGRIPWLPVGRFPTRVERVEGLLPADVELWVKREDESGDLYGGNKVRKLEFLFGAARARGRTRLVTFGGWGAHHVVATSVYGPRHGFRVEAALVPQPLDDHVREQLLIDRACGTRVTELGSYLGVLPVWARAVFGPGARDAAWLSGGGSSVAGTLGWASAGLELVEQVHEGELPPFDALYGALGSCGTIAGLLSSLPSSLLGRAIELVAVRVVDNPVCGALKTWSLVRSVDHHLERTLGRPPAGGTRGDRPRFRVESRFTGRYGEATFASRAAVLAAARVGLVLDPIYTGKVMAALLDDARTGRLSGRRVLFLHSHNTVDVRPLIERAPGGSVDLGARSAVQPLQPRARL